MIRLYTTRTNNASNLKVRKFLKEHNISFLEKDISSTKTTDGELLELFARNDEDIEDLFRTDSSYFSVNNLDFYSLTTKDLINIIHERPNILKLPLLVDEKRLLIGYNSDEIRKFIPKNQRI